MTQPNLSQPDISSIQPDVSSEKIPFLPQGARLALENLCLTQTPLISEQIDLSWKIRKSLSKRIYSEPTPYDIIGCHIVSIFEEYRDSLTSSQIRKVESTLNIYEREILISLYNLSFQARKTMHLYLQKQKISRENTRLVEDISELNDTIESLRSSLSSLTTQLSKLHADSQTIKDLIAQSDMIFHLLKDPSPESVTKSENLDMPQLPHLVLLWRKQLVSRYQGEKVVNNIVQKSKLPDEASKS